MSLYRPEFEAALRLLARVSEAMQARGLPRPVLVGGAAAEYHSGSAISTGDFDLCSPVQPELEEELRRVGFVRPSGPGRFTRGWIHPQLRLGFEIVGDTPLDGNVARERLLLVEEVEPGAAFIVIAVEDLIADRMGQYASGTAADRLGQARTLAGFTPTATWIILSVAFARRVMVTTASKTSSSDWPGGRTTFAAAAARLAERRAELGSVDMPRNAGERRTASKLDLLAAVRDAGGEW